MFAYKSNPLLYNHASILEIFMNISHDIDPMRDMTLKIRNKHPRNKQMTLRVREFFHVMQGAIAESCTLL